MHAFDKRYGTYKFVGILLYIHLYEHIANQNSVRSILMQLVTYFTNFAVQTVNKIFVYIADLTSTLRAATVYFNCIIRFDLNS